MKFVYHVDDEPAQLMIDGRTIVIPPDELYEVKEIRGNHFNNNGPCEYIIPENQVAAEICRQGWYHGIVEVPVIRTKTGMTTDVEAARNAASLALGINQDRMLAQYVSEQQERVTMHAKAAIAPNGRILKIITSRGIDLKKEFNIDPPGYKLEKMGNQASQIADLQRELAELKEAIGAKPKK